MGKRLHLLASLHHNNKDRLTASELGATRPWGTALKRHKPVHFRRDLAKEALLTSSDSGEDSAAGAAGGAGAAGAAASSKKLADRHKSELEPRLRISSSKLR